MSPLQKALSVFTGAACFLSLSATAAVLIQVVAAFLFTATFVHFFTELIISATLFVRKEKERDFRMFDVVGYGPLLGRGILYRLIQQKFGVSKRKIFIA